MDKLTTRLTYIDHWLSAEAFALASRIQTRSVRLRLRRKAITGTLIDGSVVIDALLSPPSRKLPKKMKAPRFVQPQDMPLLSTLVQVRNFCERSGIRGHDLHRDILLGKIEAWCFADRVFIEDTPMLQQYVKHRR